MQQSTQNCHNSKTHLMYTWIIEARASNEYAIEIIRWIIWSLGQEGEIGEQKKKMAEKIH